jgi:hypothetical protein
VCLIPGNGGSYTYGKCMNITFNNNLCLLMKYAVVFEVCSVLDSNKCVKIIVVSNKFLLNNEHCTDQDCIIGTAFELKSAVPNHLSDLYLFLILM